MVKEVRRGTGTRLWQTSGPLALVAAFAIVVAGCSASTNHRTVTNHKTSTNHKKNPVPVVTGIAPSSGPTRGGIIVTITGTGFTGTTNVAFGTVAAVSYIVVSDSEISALLPAEAASVQNIIVTTAGGTSKPLATVDQFTYKAPVPVVTGIAPSSGTTAGGTTVTITGTGFTWATKVTFGTVVAISYTVVSDTEISAVSPAKAAGVQNIIVTTAGGTSQPVVAVDQFTYRARVPVVTGIAPSSGTTAGGITVTITGTGFTGATRVAFGGVAATRYTVVSDTEITAVSPTRAASTPYIFVTTAGGTSKPVVAVDQFTYNALVPVVTGIAPSSGTTAGGTTITITGTGFIGVTKVAFGTVAAVRYTVVSDTEITAVSPAKAASTPYILVTTAGGTSKPVVAVDQFTYKA